MIRSNPPMPVYVWKGRRPDGAAVAGDVVAETKEAVMAILRQDEILVSSVKERGKEITLAGLRAGIPIKDVAAFTRELSVMIDGGVPLVQCLEILSSRQRGAFRKILAQVRTDVEQGSSLADALYRGPSAFDDLYAHMVAAGEAAGTLDATFRRLADLLEADVRSTAARAPLRLAQSGLILSAGTTVLAAVAGIRFEVLLVLLSLLGGLAAPWYLVHRAVHDNSLTVSLRVGLYAAGFLLGLEAALLVSGLLSKAFG